MKHRTPSLFLAGSLLAAQFLASTVEASPLRVLYLGQEDSAATQHAHVLMRDLGRDAIWFDYTADPRVATAEWIAKFDAVLLDAPRSAFPAIATAASAKVLTPDFSGAEANWAATTRISLLAAITAPRRQQWESFLANREPERREANSNVANYERRPEPLTFQQPFTVKGSIERTQVPIDMRLELFVAEPDIAKPIAFAWDERGRLWVCETRDYPHNVQASGEGNDSIKICEDTNGDGRADKFTVFADQLNIPTSLVFANGGVIISQSPRLIFLKDTNGDDRADVREVIMEGWGIQDTHAQANSLHYGYDNWLYGCVGYSGFRGTIGGKELRFAQGTFRFKADGSALEFLHQFSNNSWGHSANAAGDQFGGTANGAPIFYGGIPATLSVPGVRVMTAKKINVEDKVHTITPNFRQVDVFGGYTAAAGSAFIYSANMPERVQGMAMICEPTMKTISLMDVQPVGAGYVAKDGFNLVASTDEWMSPVFAEVGPDGAVWFADWQNFIIQHNPTPSAQRGGYDARTGVGGAHENPLRDHERGRIYRVVWDQAKAPATKSLGGATTAQLVAALNDDNQFWRLKAQRLLVEGGRKDAAEALKKIVTVNTGDLAAIHALWSLEGLGLLDDDTHRAALLAKDPVLRRNAVRALSADKRGRDLYFSSAVISDPDLITRLAALVKLGEFATDEAIKNAVKSQAAKPENLSDEWLSEVTRLLARVHDTEAFREGPNLLPNPGFEVVGADGLPEGWKRRDYGDFPGNAGAAWEIVSGQNNARSGTNGVRVRADQRADTSLHADVELKPNTQYRLAGWVGSDNLRGKVSLNDHLGRVETELLRMRSSDWREVEVLFNSGNRTRASINVLFVASGEGYFDDVKLAELIPINETVTVAAGDAKRGEEIFFKHTAACVLCHQLNGQGSTVGPALDGIAARQTDEYIRDSLLEPSKDMAKGFEQLEISPMPPMGDIFSPQELADVEAFMKTLK
jgi:putative membrane-bound dehydrogenase-like protein